MSGVTVRTLGADDLDAYFDVRAQSFGVDGTDRELWKAWMLADTGAAMLGAFAADELVGALRVLVAGQYLLGRSVPTGAIAAVVVRPEMRGRRVAATLLDAALDWMDERGIVHSVLHPASTRVYRSMGWEIAGPAGFARVPTGNLASIRGEAAGEVVRLPPTARAQRRACYDAVAPTVHGAIDRSESFWIMRDAGLEDDGAFLYGVQGPHGLSGYVAYRQHPRREWGYALTVDEIVATDAPSALALWHFLGGHAMQVEHVVVPIAVLPGLLMLLDEQWVEPVGVNRWMARVVDLRGFMASRGFPSGLSGEASVQLTDPWSHGLTGGWQLTVRDGVGQALGVDRGAVRLDVGALSALAMGRVTAAELRAVGRLDGDADDVAALGSLFVAPGPVITDDF